MSPWESVLDVRELEPPEPYQLATDTLTHLTPGRYVKMISRRAPRLLYPWLEEHGFDELTREISADRFEIYIWIKDDFATGEYLREYGPDSQCRT